MSILEEIYGSDLTSNEKNDLLDLYLGNFTSAETEYPGINPDIALSLMNPLQGVFAPLTEPERMEPINLLDDPELIKLFRQGDITKTGENARRKGLIAAIS